MPLEFDPQDNSRALVLYPDRPGDTPSRIMIGDRGPLVWHALYAGPRVDQETQPSLEDCVCLSPLVIFDSTQDDYRFFNRFADGELEYVSYRSGDFDFQPADSPDWFTTFRLPNPEPDPVDTGDEPGSDSLSTEDERPTANKSDGPSATATDPNPTVVPAKSPEIEATQIADRLRSQIESIEFGNRKAVASHLETLHRDLEAVDDDVLTLSLSKTAESLSTASDDARQFLASLQYRLGDYEGSIHVLRGLFLLDAGNVEYKHLLARSLFQQGKILKSEFRRTRSSGVYEKSRELLEEAEKLLAEIAKGPANSYYEQNRVTHACSMLVDVYCRLGNFDDAIEYCDLGLKKDPQNQRLNSQRHFLYERTGK